MGRENSNRTRIIGLRLTPKEYAIIERKWKASTCRKLSDYVRHNLFEKPITSYYRNQSLDDFMTEMVLLRTELNHIGNKGISKNCFFIPHTIKLFVWDCEFLVFIIYVIDIQCINYCINY